MDYTGRRCKIYAIVRKRSGGPNGLNTSLIRDSNGTTTGVVHNFYSGKAADDTVNVAYDGDVIIFVMTWKFADPSHFTIRYQSWREFQAWVAHAGKYQQPVASGSRAKKLASASRS